MFFIPWDVKKVSIIQYVENHREWIPLSYSIQDVDGFGYEVVELEFRPSSLEEFINELDVNCWDLSPPEVVDQTVGYRIGESALDVEEYEYRLSPCLASCNSQTCECVPRHYFHILQHLY